MNELIQQLMQPSHDRWIILSNSILYIKEIIFIQHICSILLTLVSWLMEIRAAQISWLRLTARLFFL